MIWIAHHSNMESINDLTLLESRQPKSSSKSRSICNRWSMSLRLLTRRRISCLRFYHRIPSRQDIVRWLNNYARRLDFVKRLETTYMSRGPHPTPLNSVQLSAHNTRPPLPQSKSKLWEQSLALVLNSWALVTNLTYEMKRRSTTHLPSLVSD